MAIITANRMGLKIEAESLIPNTIMKIHAPPIKTPIIEEFPVTVFI
jgi:hypothetical protein